MALLRVQKTAQMPLVQFTEKLVEFIVIMRTSAGLAIRRSGEHSNCAADSATARCREPGKIRKAVETTQVQFKEPAIQKRMPTIKKTPETVETIHAVIQEQVPNIAKTDEIPQAQFMPRRCTTTRCAETVPNIQEIQETD